MLKFSRIFIVVICLMASTAHAQNNKYNFTYNKFFPQTSAEFIKGLKPQASFNYPNFNGKTRGLNVSFGDSPKAAPSVNLQVRFAFNSYRLSDESKYILLELAKALQSSELQSYKFALYGHTDSVGSQRYNLSLSKKRSHAVYRYLVNTLGINLDRLETSGFGETKLLDPHNPRSYVNRRVEIVNLGN